jgi:preprotein translocase subunit SecF
LPVTTLGRLLTPEQFEQVVIKTGADGRITRVRDVARIELGARDYAVNSYLNNQPAVAIAILQRPGSNGLATADAVLETMQRLSKQFPAGLEYTVVYNPTVFVRESIEAVIHTLYEAVGLVVLVVLLFLQTWRASVIPLLAIPVSLIGTFAAMAALGFSLNMLSLFGLVLAIGIVVDDAIVVVENVERHIAQGLAPREAARLAMDEVTPAVIAIAFGLCAVFVPTAFVSGISGQFYRQFALTIAVSTLLSAFNSLTLSPAMCALLLRPHDAPKDWFGRLWDRFLGRFFTWFNRNFERLSHGYSGAVAWLLRRSILALGFYVIMIGPHRVRLPHAAERLHSGPGRRLLHRRDPTAGRRLTRAHGRRRAGGVRHHHEDAGRPFRRRLRGLLRRDARQRVQCRRHLRRTAPVRRAHGERSRRGRPHQDAAPPARGDPGGRHLRRPAAAGARASARRAASSSWSRIAAAAACRPCRRPPSSSSMPPSTTRASPACSPPSAPRRRSSSPISTASAPRS